MQHHRGGSPEMILVRTPAAARRATAAPAEALGGSRKAQKPAKTRSCSASTPGGARRAGHAARGHRAAQALPAWVRLPMASSAPRSHRPIARRRAVQAARTASGAPLTTSSGPSGARRAPRSERRSKPKGASASALPALGGRLGAPGSRHRASRGRRRGRPLTAASPPAARRPAPSGARLRARAIRASVSVPVLSVQSTSIAPRSWMAASRFTTTLRAAMRIAPRESVTVVTIGSSSGVRPTASATANRSEFQRRPAEDELDASTTSTRTSGQPQDQQAEAVQPALEGGGPAASASAAAPRRAGWPGRWRPPAWSPPPPRDGAAEQGIEGLGRAAGLAGPGPLGDRIGLAGQQRLVRPAGRASPAPRHRPGPGRRRPARPRRRGRSPRPGRIAPRRRDAPRPGPPRCRAAGRRPARPFPPAPRPWRRRYRRPPG